LLNCNTISRREQSSWVWLGCDSHSEMNTKTRRYQEAEVIAACSVSVCFPAYNEHRTVEAVLREADELLRGSSLEYEILVCDDGSNDGTEMVLGRLAAEIPGMRLIRHEKNLGIRATFEHLYSEARKDFVFLNSTDQQWQTSVLFDLLPLVREWDIAIASRIDKHYGWTRALVSWVFNGIPRWLFGVMTYDAGAVKLVRREIIGRFDLVSRSPFSEAERLIRAARFGYRIADHPVRTRPRLAGKSTGVQFSSVAQALADVCRVWWALRRDTARDRRDTIIDTR
jgi:dolichol-phosphate mannosyltransferase